ncbi:MAG: ribosomal-processing cysteine protease Prp [Oenococcus oeni]
MIQVTIKRNQDQFSLIVTGHAGFNDYGRDIVCAAVSILLEHTSNHLTDAVVKDDGIRYELMAMITDNVDQAFVSALKDTLCLISGSYPKNLSVSVEG